MENAEREAGALEVSAVLPAYEEAGALDWVVARALEALEGSGARCEVIVVAHASARDGTPERARAWSRRDPRVRVVVQPAGPRGYGQALALGIASARLPWIFLCDADGQFDPLEFPLLARAAPGVDLVAGVRSPRADPWPRRLAAWVYNRLMRALLEVPLRDTDCAFKLFRRESAGAALRHAHLADGELVARILRGGGTWREVEVPHRPRSGGRSQAEGRAGFPRLSLVVAVVREMARLRLELGGAAPGAAARPGGAPR